MKIAYIYDAVYPWIKGGAEKRIYEIGKRLSDKEHEVHWYEIGCGGKTLICTASMSQENYM